jgi:hypothetical protein
VYWHFAKKIKKYPQKLFTLIALYYVLHRKLHVQKNSFPTFYDKNDRKNSFKNIVKFIRGFSLYTHAKVIKRVFFFAVKWYVLDKIQ